MPITYQEIYGVLSTVKVTNPISVQEDKLLLGLSIGLSVFLPKVVYNGVGGGGLVGTGVGVGVGVGVLNPTGLGVMNSSVMVLNGAPSVKQAVCNTLGGLLQLPLRVNVSCIGLGGVGSLLAIPTVVVSSMLEGLVGVLTVDIQSGMSSVGVVGVGVGDMVNKLVVGVMSLLRAGIVISSPVVLVSPSPPICAPSPVPVLGLPIVLTL